MKVLLIMAVMLGIGVYFALKHIILNFGLFGVFVFIFALGAIYAAYRMALFAVVKYG